jgi:uncharacterized protein YhaN
MRIRELNLIRYGKFTGRSLDLPFKDRDIHLIVGPNEAGKSTVRTAIGDWLFGIPMRTPLGFLHPKSELRIGGMIERRGAGPAEGEMLAFYRSKGNKNTLRTPDDAPLPDGILHSWLGSLQVQAFNRMYALDHTTLVEGGAGILSASDDIGRMLFQSASGVKHLGDVLQKLLAEADAVWAPRKSGTRAYYKAHEAYEIAHAELRRSTLRTSDWMDQHNALIAKEAQLAEAKARDVALRTQLSRLERIRRVRPLLLVLDAARAELIELLATDDIPLLEETAAQVFASATQDITLADADISRLQREIEETQTDLLATVVDKKILALQEDIKELNERRLQFRAHHTDMVKRAEEIRLEWVRAQELALSLNWPADSEQVVRQRLPATPLRERLTLLINSRAGLVRDLENARANLCDCEEQIQQGETELSQLGAGAVDPDLESTVDQALKLGDHEKVMADLQDEIDGLTQKIEEALAALGAWHRPVESLRAMSVPDTAHIQSLIDHEREDAAKERAYRDALDAKAREAAQQALDLQQLVRNFQPVSREQVMEARSARDLSWQGIKQAPQSLSDRSAEFEGQISEADKLADDRLDRAQYEADRQSKTDALEYKQREHLDLESRLQAVKNRMEERIDQWDDLATACGLPALPINMALTWLQLRQNVLDLVGEVSAAERRRLAQQAAAAKIRDSLWNRLGHDAAESPAPELSVCLREARGLITQAAEVQGQRRTLGQQIRDSQRRLGRLRRTLQAAQKKWDEWMQSWLVAVQSVGYDADTPVDRVEAEIEVMQNVGYRLDRIRSISSERIEPMQADLDGLAATATRLSARVAPDLADRSPEDVALELNQRLASAQRAEAAATILLTRLRRSQAELTEAQKRLQAVDARLAPLMALAGVDEVTALGQAIERSDNRRALERNIQSAEQDLIQAADGLSLEDLRRENESVGADELMAELGRVVEDSTKVVDQIGALSNDFGAQKIAFDSLNGTDQAARAEAQRQEAIAAMADAAENYLRLQTAARLLKWSIDKFRETKQGPMLSKASTIFNRLTMDSFGRLIVDSEGETPRLSGIRPSGEQVDVAGMSEGSRDQLYLALRLAALEIQVEQGLNMPLIADDLFINFDDRRTEAGMQVLGDLSLKMQVVFLTHHDHLASLGKKLLGDHLNVIYLE